MVIVKFNGGLGNQLFQWAFCKWCSSKGVTVYSDTNAYAKQTIHGGFLLPQIVHGFKNDFPNISEGESDQINKVSFLKRVQNKLTHHIGDRYFESYFKNKDDVEKMIKNCCRKVYLEGWWQNSDYIFEVWEEIISNICFPENKRVQAWRERISRVNSISLHIRRGDYINNSDAVSLYGGICTDDYYLAAMKLMMERVPDAHFFVFSNDEKYCRSFFKKYTNVTIIDGAAAEEAYADIYLMSLCKHHIVANSSFSWWGAVLGHEKGIIAMPSKWDNRQVAYKLLIPGGITIDSRGKLIKVK